MITIKELATVRELLNISEEEIANEMSTTLKNVQIIEKEQISDTMSNRFYRLTILKLIKKVDFDKVIDTL